MKHRRTFISRHEDDSNHSEMMILGIDPGTILTGYGIITMKKQVYVALTSGVIDLRKLQALPDRLEKIYGILADLIQQFRPTDFAIETAFFGKNVQSAMKIGIARGVAMLAAQHSEIPIFEYSPREVKKSVTGSGAASKEQVAGMIKTLLKLRKPADYYDESDALAVALCHAFRKGTPMKKSGSWTHFTQQHPERIIG
jgi:crossover junction endodeoxyribonuclease RuvC